ncbi:MAG TPA: L-seryl-tRNA(Sec) selenium transferase [Anaerolineae bacterium]|nr:L-seryl-tRNA(Sec) selenium transferase [Anaerolineae bacterium]
MLRQLPSVDRLLARAEVDELIAAHGRPLTTDAIRAALDVARAAIKRGDRAPDESNLIGQIAQLLREWTRPRPRSVINATGVIIHTNLGRAPLSQAALEAVQAAAAGYSDLEYDLASGERGQRMAAIEDSICRVTGAEAALVVNNNAGAVLLALSAIAAGKGVLISRGQLVEIGGGFRVPDVMAQSGARLIEIGATNRTHRRDYELALVTASSEVAAILRAHSSNFRVIGFTTEVPLAELVEIGDWRGIPVIDDLGSGALLDTAAYGLMHEPMVQESIAAGAGLVCFSGDKLLGGPQAGVIAGKRDLVERCKQHPLARALRIDKLDLAALSATFTHYLKGEAEREAPVWRMISLSLAEIEQRAQALADRLREAGYQVEVIDGRSTVGGGSLPGETLPTRLVALTVDSPDAFLARLRAGDPPVVARIEAGRAVFDLRTVLDDEALEQALLVG